MLVKQYYKYNERKAKWCHHRMQPKETVPGRISPKATDEEDKYVEWTHGVRVDTKLRFQFFAKYDYRFFLDVIIAIITTFFRKSDNRYFAIIAKYFA
jgi:hypothetical protein